MNPLFLNRPQNEFLQLNKKYKALVTGFGGGKTYVGCLDIGNHFFQFPRVNAGYFAPTYPQIRDIFYPTVEEAAFTQGFRVDIKQGNKEVHFYRGRVYYGTTICRSLEKPETIIGFKIGKALVDELDTMKTEKARKAWIKIIARMRYNVPGLTNGISVTTTPEGFKFVYQQFKKNLEENPELKEFYGLVQGSTYDNADNLPDDYIPSLIASYPEQLIKAYLNGEFVNLVAMPVWNEYDTVKNGSNETVQKDDSLLVGCDFNVGRGCAVIYVSRGNELHAVDEVYNSYDTPDTIRVLKYRYPNNNITVFPDASGASRKSVNATTSDIAALRHAGFAVKANKRNPNIKDRVMATNAMFCNGNKERLLLVNADKCKNFSDSLAQQVYDDNGLPEKGAGKFDDMTDAGSYPIAFLYPIKKITTTTSNLSI